MRRETTGRGKIDPYTRVYLTFNNIRKPRNLHKLLGEPNTRNNKIAYHALFAYVDPSYVNKAQTKVFRLGSSKVKNLSKVLEAKQKLNRSANNKYPTRFKKYFSSYSNSLLNSIGS